jgi:16S rRNA (cytosine967-C5)-methyltransferase
MAAMMQNRGQIYATDDDGRRLAPIFARLMRSGARNVQVRSPKGQADVLADLSGRCDLVLIDAPCTGSGAWRRNPDAKWRIRPGALEQRIKDQDEALEKTLRFVKPGGRIVYVTCSLLRAENEDRIAAFLARHDNLLPVDAAAQANASGLPVLADHCSPFGPGFRLSPWATGTDGFYIATLTKL